MAIKTRLIAAMLAMSAFVTGCSGRLSISGANLPSGFAQSGPFDNFLNTLIYLGTLGWLGHGEEGPVVGFMRIIIIVITGVLLYEGGRMVGLRPGIAGTIGALLAIMAGIFMPGTILVGIGGTYATVVAFILIGVPVGFGGWLYMRLPNENRFHILIRIVILVALIMILYNVKGHAMELLAIPPTSFFT